MSLATGIGSWPGTDLRRAVRTVRDLLSDQDLPYLPELPARGPGADLVGRTAGLLVDMPVDLQPAGWRLVDRPGRDAQRTATMLSGDLDELAEAFDGYQGWLKVQVAGPWTMASSVWLPRGERAVVDVGARRYLASSLAEGVRQHLGAVERLVPGASLVLQLDEPGLPSVLAGGLPTASGLGQLRAVEPEPAAAALREVVEAARDWPVVVHCCAQEVPWAVLRTVGATAVSVDTTLLGPRGWESVAASVEAGLGIWAGCVPATGTLPAVPPLVRDLVARWRDVGLPLPGLVDVTLTPACGLAGASPEQAGQVHRLLVAAARALTEAALE
ncbi:MAG TPA: methionine synthase [Dermatophilaceae bacterium]|nr:methionine synthase [Dermatophilaceae bacterium]